MHFAVNGYFHCIRGFDSHQSFLPHSNDLRITLIVHQCSAVKFSCIGLKKKIKSCCIVVAIVVVLMDFTSTIDLYHLLHTTGLDL